MAEIAANHPNAAIHLVWEAHDTGSNTWGDCATTPAAMQSWHEHMAELVHSISPDTLITTGDIRPLYNGFAFASSQVSSPSSMVWEYSLPVQALSDALSKG